MREERSTIGSRILKPLYQKQAVAKTQEEEESDLLHPDCRAEEQKALSKSSPLGQMKEKLGRLKGKERRA